MARPNNNSNGSLKESLPKARITVQSLKDGLVIFKYIRPYQGKFFAGLFFIGLSGITTMAFPYLLKRLIDSTQTLNQGSPLLTPGMLALAMMGVLSIQMVFSYLRVYLFTFVGESALSDLRKEIYERMIAMPMDFFSQHRVGELSSRISADVSQIQDAVTSVFAEFLRGILILLIGLGLILFLSVKLTFLMLSVVPIIAFFAVVFSKKIRTLSRLAQDQLADSNTVVQETLQGIGNVKSFSNEWYEINRYSNSINKVVALAVKNGKIRGLFVSLLLFSVFGVIVLVVWYGTILMQRGELTFGDLTAFVVYTAFVGGTMAGFADLYTQLQKTLGATQRVRELLKEPGEKIHLVQEPLNNEYKIKGEVTFQNISFSYPSRKDMQVLHDISIRVLPGQQVAIVGPSGTGKSTLTNLLLRFYEPDSGQVMFDGRQAGEFPLSQLRKQMALVPQDVLLFGGTIRENIAYGKPDASDLEIVEAAKKANAHEFITSFPEAYQTVVGERGIKLSGGQRQRIAIARAILKDPVILILDEATSALDSASELLVQDALHNLLKHRTSFVIAHRLSTVREADVIVVLENGSIVESGTHQELIKNTTGLYHHLYELQSERKGVGSQLGKGLEKEFI